MPANVQPIFSKASDIQMSDLIRVAATNVHDISGTIGTDIYKVWTADATNGGYLQKLRFKYASNGTNTSILAVLKIWISSVTSGTPTIGSQAVLWDEIPVPATGALSTTAPAQAYEVPFNLALPAGWCVLVKITVSQTASCGWLCTPVAGKY